MQGLVEVKQCVITQLTLRGKGVEGSPYRRIVEVWDAETGDKIAEHDRLFTYHRETDSYIYHAE